MSSKSSRQISPINKNLIKGKIYKFEWNDTYSQPGWHTEDEMKEKIIDNLHSSVGFFVEETNIWYIIAAHKNPHDTFRMWGDLNFIPKGCVTKIKKL